MVLARFRRIKTQALATTNEIPHDPASTFGWSNPRGLNRGVTESDTGVLLPRASYHVAWDHRNGAPGRYQRKVLAAGRILGPRMAGPKMADLRMMGPTMVGFRLVDEIQRPSTNLR